MKRRIISLLLACMLVVSVVISANAASVEFSDTSANVESAIIAADYAVVGGELEPTSALPSSYSSAKLGYVTDIREQLYNTCWAYSSTATLETNLLKQGKQNMHLSTMFMNFWGTTQEDGTGWQRTYTDGGYPYISLGFLTSFGELGDYLFEETSTLADYSTKSSTLYPYTSVSSAIYLDGNDKDTIKTAVYNYGAVVANFNFSSDYSNNYYTAYYCDAENLATSQLSGHAISIVGWDDNYNVSNFDSDHRPSSNGAWLCKNSWGVHFGSNGYFWISYEDNYLFDSRFGPSYTISETTDMTAITKIQQNETYGATYEFNYLSNSTRDITYVNVLDFSDGYHNIDKVVFESTAEGASYSAYYIPLDSDDAPVTDTSEWVLLGEGDIDYQGYISVNVDNFNASAEKCGIGIKIHRDSTDINNGIGVDEWLTAGGNYLFKPTSTTGQSYIIGFTSKPTELMYFYQKYLNDTIGGTFVIKAVCHNDKVNGDVDRDGEMGITDATLIQRLIANLMELDAEQMRFADYDNDGDCSIIDCTTIQYELLNLDPDNMLMTMSMSYHH